MTDPTSIIPLNKQLAEADARPVAMISSTTVDLPEHRLSMRAKGRHTFTGIT